MNRSGRVALVSGANRGIGLEVVRQLAAAGYRVLLGSRDLVKGTRALTSLGGGHDGSVEVVELDVAGSGLERQADRARDVFGRIDVLVNNAAVHYDEDQTPTGAEPRIVREALETNVLGAWRLAAHLMPAMKERGWGRVVNVSSGAGSLHDMGAETPAYGVSKAALNALTRKLATEYDGTGVLVNAVCPGWTRTDMGGGGGRPVADGARSVVWAVLLPDDGPTGGFFRDGHPIAW